MKKRERSGVLLNVELDKRLKERLDRYCEENGIKIRWLISKLLDEFLSSKGY